MARWRHDADFLAEYGWNCSFSANNSPVLSKTPNILARANAQIRRLSDDSEAASGQSPKLCSRPGRASIMARARSCRLACTCSGVGFGGSFAVTSRTTTSSSG
jgi:hypothetical protein